MATFEELMAKSREFNAAGDIENARKVAQIALKVRAGAIPPKTNLFEQTMSGVNEGLASLAGTPVDLVEGALNLGIGGINKVAGTDIPKLEGSLGGSGTMQSLMSPFVSDVPPQTMAQRYGRRIGQEVGYGAPITLATGGTGGMLAKVAGANTAGDVAAGLAGQTAREVAPKSDTADLIASLIAGGGAAGVTAMHSRARPPTYNSTKEMFDEASRLRESARGRNVQLSRPAQQEMFDRLYGRLKAEHASPRVHPKAFATLDEAKNWPNSGILDVEETRRIIGRDVAGSADEAAIGMAMKNEIDDYLKSVDASKTVGNVDPSEALSDVLASRKLTHQAHKAADIEAGTTRAINRAARTGRGGNEVNTMRQNVGKIYDKEIAPLRPGQRSGYTPDEIAGMHDVNFGTAGQNLGRHLAGMSPTTGVLPGMAGATGYGAAATGLATTGNPLFALAAVPPTAGWIAKGLTERSTKKQIAELLDTIRRGGVAAKKEMTDAGKRAIIAQLLSASNAGQSQ